MNVSRKGSGPHVDWTSGAVQGSRKTQTLFYASAHIHKDIRSVEVVSLFKRGSTLCSRVFTTYFKTLTGGVGHLCTVHVLIYLTLLSSHIGSHSIE